MGRSIKKGPFVDHHLMDKINVAKETKSHTGVVLKEFLAERRA